MGNCIEPSLRGENPWEVPGSCFDRLQSIGLSHNKRSEASCQASLPAASESYSPLTHCSQPPMAQPAQPSDAASESSSLACEPKVHGVAVTPTTQCAHWHSDRDVIAIKHKCCGEYYACISCHEVLAGHKPEVWSRGERATKAVLCGRCRRELTVDEYLGCRNLCPGCAAEFNPGCALHYELYFEV